MEVSPWCLWSPHSSSNNLQEQCKPHHLLPVALITRRPAYNCDAPLVSITFLTCGRKKKKKSNRECKSFSSLGQKTPEAARLAKNFCFSKRGHGDGGAESREGKHWIMNESVFLCPVWSAFPWTASRPPITEHRSAAGRPRWRRINCQRANKTWSGDYSKHGAPAEQLSLSGSSKCAECLELHHECSLER